MTGNRKIMPFMIFIPLFILLLLSRSNEANPISGFEHNRDNGQAMLEASRQALFASNFRPTSSPGIHEEINGKGKNGAASGGGGEAAAFPGGYLPPPRTGWKWWRYREMSDKEILDHLTDKEHYDFRELPPSPSGTVLVNVTLSLSYLRNTVDGSIEAQGLMFQRWLDPRLIHEHRKKVPGYLNGIHHSKHIWRPPVISQADIAALEIYPNGTLISISSLKIPFHCEGNAALFPFDEMSCTAKLESLAYTREEVGFQWWWPTGTLESQQQSKNRLQEASIFNQEEKERAKEETLDAIFTTRDRSLLLLERVQDFWPSQDCTDNVLAKRGNYSCLALNLRLKRDLGQYWSDFFLPDMVLVATSFLTFWLDWSAVPARAILGMGTLLSYFAHARWKTALQNIGNEAKNAENHGESLLNNEMTALDLWTAFSLAFIYLACAEFVLVHFLGRRLKKSAQVSSSGMIQQMLEHHHQKMQHQLERIRLENLTKAAATAASTPCQGPLPHHHVGGTSGSQGKFEKTATLMRHHHNNYKRHNLAIILDPFSPTSTSVGANNSMGVGHNTANFMDDQEEQPIFVPHHEKMEIRGARSRCIVHTGIWIDRMCRVIFPVTYLVFVVCYFINYTV